MTNGCLLPPPVPITEERGRTSALAAPVLKHRTIHSLRTHQGATTDAIALRVYRQNTVPVSLRGPLVGKTDDVPPIATSAH